MRFKCFSLFSVLFCFSFISATAFAGDMAPANTPANTYSYTLEDIYQRLFDGTAGTQSAFTEPADVPGATGYTLDQVMGKAPAKDDTNGAAVTDVVKDKTFWGLTGAEWGLQTGTRALAPVEKTGQTKCYTDATSSEQTCPATGFPGQDGDNQAGVAWPTDRFTNNSDGTVTDNMTGLIWLKNANVPAGTRNWQNALKDVDELNTSGTMNGGTDAGDTSNGGTHQADWRLPNPKELYSLVDLGQSSPALPSGHPFTNVQSSAYWSSATRVSNTFYAWYVFMSYGRVNYGPKVNSNYVWPVRGGQ
ncbi:DUF1566 domain-containing protein [Desulfococcaceae bacterium HSG9]|nr:DUF1566 domain-containing protein [Desulfococcaceae bacterium HSG9]